MSELSLASLAISAVITWSIGLVLPLLIRFVILRKPLKKWFAVIFSIFWLLANLIFWIAVGSESRTHMVLYIIAFITYWILTYQEKTQEEKDQEKHKKQVEQQKEQDRKAQASNDWSGS